MLTFIKTIGLRNILLLVVISFLVIFTFIQKQNINNLKTDLTENKHSLEKKTKEHNDLEIAFETAVFEYEKQLDFERDKASFVTTTLNEKVEVIKASEKVKQELIKRGEIKDEDQNNFIITKF